MTLLSRGAWAWRGGRRLGWLLSTALLVLAVSASAALVFTNQVELLKLALLLALWAAVVAEFVSVIYRRQSDTDQARLRDLKLVYDLQLDREISARREYELTVESQLRRELASELRAQAADEVVALRAELAALRTNLEILLKAELGERPALESERGINRVTSVRAEDSAGPIEDSSIIDVPEEPLVPPPDGPDGCACQAAERLDQLPSRVCWAPPQQYEPAAESVSGQPQDGSGDAADRGARHRSPDPSSNPDVLGNGGQSVADLLARLRREE